METVFQIGDCLIFKGSDNKYYGLILFSIEVTSKRIQYTFLLCGKKFDLIPNYNQFLDSGVFGNNQKNLDNPYGEPFFNHIGIEANVLKKMIEQFVKIGQIVLDDKLINLGGGSGGLNLEDTTDSLNFYFKFLGIELGVNRYIIEIFPIELLICKTTNSITKKISYTWVLSRETAHPIALKLLDESFYWDENDFSSPFGNDQGYDGLYSFQKWRVENPTVSPTQFVYALAKEWNPNIYNLNESDAKKIDGFLDITVIPNFDDTIIGICLGQLVLEGIIEPNLKLLGKAAISRQLHPKMINLWPDVNDRKEKLNKEFEVFVQAPS